VRDEWFVHELSLHSIVNMQTVPTHALFEQPQVWVGTLADDMQPDLTMQSEVPSAGNDVPWADRVRAFAAAEKAARRVG